MVLKTLKETRIFLQIIFLFSLLFVGVFSCAGGSGGGGSPVNSAGPSPISSATGGAIGSIDSNTPAAGPSGGAAGPSTGDVPGSAVAPAGAAMGAVDGGTATVAAAGPQAPSLPADVPVNDECAPFYQKYFYIREHGERAWVAHCRTDETCWEREQSCRSDERCLEFPEEQDLAAQMRCESDRRCRELADRCRRIERFQDLERECMANVAQMRRWLRDHPINSQHPVEEEERDNSNQDVHFNVNLPSQRQMNLNSDKKAPASLQFFNQ